MDTQSLLILVDYLVTPCYDAVGTHPTGMLSCQYNTYPQFFLEDVFFFHGILS